jgi:ketosteroid isomerase-like protein
MPKAKLRAATVGGTADIIEAQFYEALQTGDIEKLMACWADEDDIVCVHPNGVRLVGSARIRSVYEAMFAHGTLAVQPEQVCKVESLTSAMHNLIEHVVLAAVDGKQETVVVATNVYQRTPQGWRMVAHHASPSTARSLTDKHDTPQVLH